jgi:hypothetical protein
LKRISNRTIGLIAAGLGIALLITLFSPLASSSPDGLERVAEDKEFIDKAEDAPYEVIADYVFPWVENEDAATVLAGIVGVLIVAGVAFTLALGIQRFGRRSSSPETGRNTGRENPP